MTDNDALVREQIADIIDERVSSPASYGDQNMEAAHRRDQLRAADEILAALRSTPQPKSLDLPAQDEVEVVAVAVAQSTPQPGAVVNQCLTELGDAEPLVVSKEDDGWAVRTLSAWRLLHPAGDDALREENARLRGALENAANAIDEMFRYFDGGETRGSYDGKPERAQLRKAGYAVRAALTRRQG